ncbi:MAG TPA: hypothetical protein PKC28_04330 [Bdellovibrionales bacterium]|nr:hypothetical protein [Bdellovibrionales bacterium]
MNETEIKLFGAFRKYMPSGSIRVNLPDGVTAGQVKEMVKRVLQQQVPDFSDTNLVYESALATESEILAEDSVIDNQSDLALLPPVCGG